MPHYQILINSLTVTIQETLVRCFLPSVVGGGSLIIGGDGLVIGGGGLVIGGGGLIIFLLGGFTFRFWALELNMVKN